MVSDTAWIIGSVVFGAFLYWLVLDHRGKGLSLSERFGSKWNDKEKMVHLGFIVSIFI